MLKIPPTITFRNSCEDNGKTSLLERGAQQTELKQNSSLNKRQIHLNQLDKDLLCSIRRPSLTLQVSVMRTRRLILKARLTTNYVRIIEKKQIELGSASEILHHQNIYS